MSFGNFLKNFLGSSGQRRVKVLVLAGGYGTRLQQIAKDVPKPLLPIRNRPLIDYILDKIQGLSGLQEVLVVTNNKFAQVFEKWATAKGFSVPIKVINDGTNTPEERLGSMGDINFVIERESLNADVLVIGGDNLFDYALTEFLIFAQRQQENTTIGLYDVGEKTKAKIYGVVTLDAQGKLTSFEEKPAEPKSSLIGMCLYYYPQKSLGLVGQYLRETQKSDTAGDYIRWLYQKQPVYGFKFSGKWYDIGSVESYYDAEKNFKG